MLEQMTNHVAQTISAGLTARDVRVESEGEGKPDHLHVSFLIAEPLPNFDFVAKEYLEPLTEALLRAIPNNPVAFQRPSVQTQPDGALRCTAEHNGVIVRGTEAFDGSKQAHIFTIDALCQRGAA